MKRLKIIFADQLSKNNPVLSDINSQDYLLFYEPLDTFYDIKHHKQKIVLLVSAIRSLVKDQTHNNILHHKISKSNKLNLSAYLKKIIKEHNFNQIVVSKPSDFQVYKDLMFLNLDVVSLSLLHNHV